jgi:hypothetical protein
MRDSVFIDEGNFLRTRDIHGRNQYSDCTKPVPIRLGHDSTSLAVFQVIRRSFPKHAIRAPRLATLIGADKGDRLRAECRGFLQPAHYSTPEPVVTVLLARHGQALSPDSAHSIGVPASAPCDHRCLYLVSQMRLAPRLGEAGGGSPLRFVDGGPHGGPGHVAPMGSDLSTFSQEGEEKKM